MENPQHVTDCGQPNSTEKNEQLHAMVQNWSIDDDQALTLSIDENNSAYRDDKTKLFPTIKYVISNISIIFLLSNDEKIVSSVALIKVFWLIILS